MWILKQFPSAGADQGMLHTVSGHLRHQVLHIALQGALGLLGSTQSCGVAFRWSSAMARL